MTSLCDKQESLVLAILNNDWKQYHRDLTNKNYHKKDRGNLIIVCKPVKTSITAGISAKLMNRTRGPYQVFKKLVDDTSYHVQKYSLPRDKVNQETFSKNPWHAWNYCLPVSSWPRKWMESIQS